MSDFVVNVTDVSIVVEENTGKMVSVFRLTSVSRVVFDVVGNYAGKSFPIVVATKTATVVNAPATTKNIRMNFMRLTTFPVTPETP